jgi:tetratricopeptide (TPR) repeat protein
LLDELHESGFERPDGLYNLIHRSDVLSYSYSLCRASLQHAGVDGQTFGDIDSYGSDLWLEELALDVEKEVYRPSPVLLLTILVGEGRFRFLGIPSIRDRVLQAALMLVLTPALGREPGYPPPMRAGIEVHRGFGGKFSDVVPFARLLRYITSCGADRRLVDLIRRWLTSPLEDDRSPQDLSAGLPRSEPLLENRPFMSIVNATVVTISMSGEATGEIGSVVLMLQREAELFAGSICSASASPDRVSVAFRTGGNPYSRSALRYAQSVLRGIPYISGAGLSTGTVLIIEQGDSEPLYTSVFGRPVADSRRLASASEGVLLTDSDEGWQSEISAVLVPQGIGMLQGCDLWEVHRTLTSKCYRGAMVGRQEEIERLDRFLAPLYADRSPGVLCIWAGAGVGKSRLVHEMSVIRDDLNWVTVAADEVIRERSHPFHSFLGDFFCQDRGLDQACNEETFEAIWDGLLLNVSIAEEKSGKGRTSLSLRQHRSAIRAMLDLSVDGTLFSELDPQSRALNIHLAIGSFFSGLALLRPVVVVLDNIQWFSDEDLDCVVDLLRSGRSAALAIVVTGRPEDDGSRRLDSVSWCADAKRIDLEGLARESIPAFFRNITGVIPSRELTNTIWDVAGGIPLFIEQIAGYILDKRCRKSLDSPSELDDLPEEMPRSLEELFSARIGMQTPDLRAVAETASVLGREFSADILELLLPESDLGRLLLEGARMRIWVPIGNGRFSFSHVLFRDQIYSNQLEHRIQNLHGNAGLAIERLHGGRHDNFTELARHFELAAELDKAVFYLSEAGRTAVDNYRNTEAIGLYLRLRNLLSGRERCRVEVELAKAMESDGRWQEGIDVLRGCIEFLSGSVLREDMSLLATAQNLLGDILCRKGAFKEAEEVIGSALCLFGEISDVEGEITSRAVLGRILRHTGRNARALILLEGCADRARTLDSPVTLCCVLGILGSLKLQMGFSKASRECFCEEIVLAEKYGLRRREAAALLNMLNLCRSAGEIEEALRYYHRLVEVAEEIGDANAIGIASNSMGAILADKSDFEGALECFKAYLDASEKKNSMHGIVTATCNMGVAYRMMGDYMQAIDCFMTVIDVSTLMKNHKNVAIAYSNIGRLFSEMGKYESAIDCSETLRDLSKEVEFPSGEASALMIKSTSLHGLKEYEQALETINLSLEKTKEISEWRKLPNRLLNKAIILFDMKHSRESSRAFEEALSASLRYEQPGIEFTARIYMAVIMAPERRAESILAIEDLLEKASTPEQEASACYHHFRISGDNDYRLRAIDLYRGILKARKLEKARERIDELSKESGLNLP